MSTKERRHRRLPRVGPRHRRDACCPASTRCTRSRSWPRGFGALGYTMQLPLEDRYLMTQQDLQSQLAVLLGGRSAEEIAFGEVSTGAQNDLQRATDIARAMVTEFGMSETLGVVNYNGQQAQRLPGHRIHAGARQLRRGHRAEDRRRGEAHPDRGPRRSPADPARAPRTSSTSCRSGCSRRK